MLWAIAFYLAQINPVYKERLLNCLRKAETLLDYDISTQADRLLIEPLTGIDYSKSQPPAIIVIDALDECNDVESVAEHLVRVIMKATSSLRLVITSRDLPEIQVMLAWCVVLSFPGDGGTCRWGRGIRMSKGCGST